MHRRKVQKNKGIKNKKNIFIDRIRIFIDKHILDFVFTAFFLFSLLLIFSLYKLQIVKGEKYNQQVLAQTKGYSISKMKRRGTIFFTNHDQEKTAVALQGIGYTIAVNPKYIKNAAGVYEKISKIIDLDKKEFIKKATKKNDPYEEVANRISEKKIAEIKKLDLDGIIFVKEAWRKYPFNEVSGKVIGFTNVDVVGNYGLEKYYENILSRKKKDSGKNIFMSFFEDESDKDLFAKKIISKEGDLIASIDIGLSTYVEKVLKKIDKKYNSKYSAAIVIKPATGEIIAMTDSRTFDLNKKRKDYRNEFVEHRFEVGSTFKPLVVAIGLESGKVKKDFSFYDSGCIKFPKKTICNFDKKGRGENTNLQTIISQSLNTGMIEIERKIGHDNFLEYMLDLGLAEETGVDIAGEISSNISNLNDGVDIDYAAASFGQGIAFTPIGITRALSAIASDGYMVAPHIVQKIDYGGLIPDKEFTSETEKIFSPYTIKTIKDIMVKRADDYAEKKSYYNKNYAVASKTGTAQIADTVRGGYYTDKNIHSYFGFFPAYGKPEDRYAIFIYTLEPKNVKYSSQTLTEPFYNIVNFMIPYFKIKPDRVRVSL